MKVGETTRFYMEQDGQWYKVLTTSIAHSVLAKASNEADVWKALEQAGFQKGVGTITSEQDTYKGDSTYCQTLPVSRQEVDEDCLPEHFSCRCAMAPHVGAFKTVEEMRRWMVNGCPM